MIRLSDRIILDQWCVGDCGLSAWRHRRGEVFLDVIHFVDRRFTKRAAKRLLVLAARRTRLADPGYLNAGRYDWLYLWTDAVGAQDLARQFGFRLPSRLFDRERVRCRHLAAMQRVPLSKHEAVRSWLRG